MKKLKKIAFYILIILSAIPLLIGLIITCILSVIPFSMRVKSIKGGINDSIGMFNSIKDELV